MSQFSSRLQALPPFWRNAMPYALLVLAVWVAYADVYRNEFVFDDIPLIRDNQFLTSWHYLGKLFTTHVLQGAGRSDAFYRPLMIVLYLCLYQFAGPSPLAFHLLNLVLHITNACLLYTLGRQLGFQRIATLLATLLWALHPVQTEAVAYASGTADLLCGSFLIGGILILTRGFSGNRIIESCAMFILALLSKETAVVFPLLAMGLLFYRSERRWSLSTYLPTWPFWLITVAYLIARSTVLNFGGFLEHYNNNAATPGFVDRFLTFLATLPTYLRLIVWPVQLHMIRDFPTYHLPTDVSFYRIFLMPEIAKGTLILAAALTGIVWNPLKRATPLAWGLLWAAAMHIPQSGIFSGLDAMIFEHWLYLPTAGLALGLGESMARVPGRLPHIILASVAVAIACLLGALTCEQNKVWRNSIVFNTHILDCGEVSARAHNNLGSAYAEEGDYGMAVGQFRLAIGLADTYAIAHYNLATNLLKVDQSQSSIDEAIEHYQRALELDPNLFQAAETLASIYEHFGDEEKALTYRAKAAAIKKKFGIH